MGRRADPTVSLYLRGLEIFGTETEGDGHLHAKALRARCWKPRRTCRAFRDGAPNHLAHGILSATSRSHDAVSRKRRSAHACRFDRRTDRGAGHPPEDRHDAGGSWGTDIK